MRAAVSRLRKKKSICRCDARSARYEIIPQLQGVRVLVVDDDSNTAISVSHMVQEIAMELLSNAGFSVSLADDGDVAVETLRTAAPDQFDLVLMAIQMPKLDGYSATRQIRTTDGAIAKVLG